MSRDLTLVRQIVVRLDDELHAAIVADANDNGRTPSQTVRHLLRQAFGLGPFA